MAKRNEPALMRTACPPPESSSVCARPVAVRSAIATRSSAGGARRAEAAQRVEDLPRTRAPLPLPTRRRAHTGVFAGAQIRRGQVGPHGRRVFRAPAAIERVARERGLAFLPQQFARRGRCRFFQARGDAAEIQALAMRGGAEVEALGWNGVRAAARHRFARPPPWPSGLPRSGTRCFRPPARRPRSVPGELAPCPRHPLPQGGRGTRAGPRPGRPAPARPA